MTHMKESKEIKVTLFDLPVQTLLTQKLLASMVNEEASDRIRALTLIHAKSILDKKTSFPCDKARKIYIIRIKTKEKRIDR